MYESAFLGKRQLMPGVNQVVCVNDLPSINIITEDDKEMSLILESYLKDTEVFISGRKMIRRAIGKLGISSGLRHCDLLLQKQLLIPEEWRDYFLVFPNSYFYYSSGCFGVYYLKWVSRKWEKDYQDLDAQLGTGGLLVNCTEIK